MFAGISNGNAQQKTTGMYRAYVPLLNLETFYHTFDIKPGDGMYTAPDKRVIIW